MITIGVKEKEDHRLFFGYIIPGKISAVWYFQDIESRYGREAQVY